MKVYRAAVGLNYPDAEGLALIKKAGGVSRLTADDRASITEIRVEAGAVCDGLPKSAQKWLQKDGYITAEDGAAAGAE